MCDAEKERIMDYLKKEKRPKRHIALKAICTAAACFVLLVTASVFSPVLAKSIPFMENIVAFIKQEKLPQSDAIDYGAVENYINPVTDVVNGTNSVDTDQNSYFRITGTYCDGTLLVMSVAAKAPDIDEEATFLTPYYAVEINGKTLTNENGETARFGETNLSLSRAEDDVFVGSIAIDVSAQNLTEDFTVTLIPEKVRAINPKYQVLADPKTPMAYIPKSYPFDTVFESCTITVGINTGLRREYDVNETYDTFTLNRIVTSPGFTYLDYTQPENRVDGYYITVSDQDGKELKWLNEFAELGLSKSYYAAIPTNTTEIHVALFNWYNTAEPVKTFTIPVEGGYDVVPMIDTSMGMVPEDAIYDPPLPETNSDGSNVPNPNDPEYPLGETMLSYHGNLWSSENKENETIEITYSNMQIYDSPAELGLTQADMVYKDKPLKWEDNKFVTFNVHLETKGIHGLRSDEELQPEIDAYEKNDGTTGILWICDFGDVFCRTVNTDIGNPKMFNPTMAYSSLHSNGVSNYYHFPTNAYDSHDVVVGFYIPETLLKSGDWVIGVITGNEKNPITGSGIYSYYTIPSVDLD